LVYLDIWVKTFENAGWTRIEYPKSDNPLHIQNFTLPTPEYNNYHQYCSWTTKDYHAVINISIRDSFNYKHYVPKAERNKVKTAPDGYIVFIKITKKSQYPFIYNNKNNERVKNESK
jgi:hypothetical protein